VATVSANRWGYNQWEWLFNSNFQTDFSLGDAIDDISRGEITTSSDTYLAGWFYGGGTFTISGSGLEYATREEDVTFTRMTISWPGGDSFEINGNLRGGGNAGVQGQITYAKMVENGDSFTVRGDLRINYFGDTYAYNAIEETSLRNGVYVLSKTDSTGNYTQHYAHYQGNSITIDGNWSYGPIYELADLFSGNDTFNGTLDNDFFRGYAGNDRLMGGNGVDTAVFNGLGGDYAIQALSSGEMQISDRLTSRDGVDTLSSVERLMFSDQNIAFDFNGPTSAGGIYRLYQATFDRTPDLGGLGFWIDRADSGQSAVSMGEDFVWSQEFQQLYGVTTQDQYLSGSDITALVTGFYRNVLGREPDLGGLNFYVGVINDQERTVGRVLAEISDSPENYAATIGVIENGIQYDAWLG
jgi:hypothetical protein